MPASDYFNVVKKTLTDVEKDRIVAIYLNTTDATINWDKATADYGAKSVDSMKVSLRNTKKKLDEATAAAAATEGAAPPPPAANKGKKRKNASEEKEETEGPKRKRASKWDQKPEDMKDQE